jgi:hypothetical protein
MTTTNVNLVAKMEDGKTIMGESEIPEYAEKQNTYIEKLYVDPENPKPMDGAIDEIMGADIIVIGPRKPIYIYYS